MSTANLTFFAICKAVSCFHYTSINNKNTNNTYILNESKNIKKALLVISKNNYRLKIIA